MVGFPEEEVIEKEFAANGEPEIKQDAEKVVKEASQVLENKKPKSNLGGWLLLTLTLGGIGFAMYKSNKE